MPLETDRATATNTPPISIGNAFWDLSYADDVVLFAERQEILASAIQSVEEESSKFWLHISWKYEGPELGSWN